MKIILLFLLILSISCDSDNYNENPQSTAQNSKNITSKSIEGRQENVPLITFVELGSVNCIPCKKMQPIMKAIEKKYGEQIKVVFYDVWKPDQKKYGQEYGIRLIPTQVFLDKNGVEIFRHEGFLPEHEIDVFLQSNGLKPQNES
jgi:thioredoxin 1